MLLKESRWDLIVIDEAHKLSASNKGDGVEKTQRYKLAEMFSKITRHFWLMTAPPHNGKEDSFQLFMSLIDEDRFYAHPKSNFKRENIITDDVMRRMVKEGMCHFDGTPLSPNVPCILSHTVFQTARKGFTMR